MGKSEAINLFKFLKELNDLKTKKVLDFDKFEKVLWFNEIPNEKECYSITHNSDSEPSNFEKWIEIKKPKVRNYPDPSAELKKWLKEDTLKNFKSKPALYEYIFQEQLDENREVFNKKQLLKDSVEIQREFDRIYSPKFRKIQRFLCPPL